MAAGYKLKLNDKDVSSAGTAERLLAITDAGKLTHSVEITAKSGNTGDVFIGDSTVTSSNTPGLSATEQIVINGPLTGGHQELIDLSEIFLDVTTNDDGVLLRYIVRAN